MRAAPRVTVYEQVTSDTNSPLPEPTPLTLTGAQFLATEPHSSGTAPQIVALPAPAGHTRLAAGFPSENIYAQLTLDRTGRLVDEQLTDPQHLIRRHFTYPEPGR